MIRIFLKRARVLAISFLPAIILARSAPFVKHVDVGKCQVEVAPTAASALDWSILICSLPLRAKNLSLLVNRLIAQIEKAGLREKIEVLVYVDFGEYTTGFKRNILLKQCCGEYISFIDDDDVVSENYVTKIYEKIKCRPDVIALKGVFVYNGRPSRLFVRSIKCEKASKRGAGIESRFTLLLNDPILRGVYSLPIFCGFVNHLNPIRKNIALRCLFPDQVFVEDCEYMASLFKSGLIKKELEVDEILYYYIQ